MSWREIIYTLDERNDPAINAVVDAICKTHVNGGMICRCFRPLNGAAYDHAHRNDLQGVKRWLQTFLEAQSIRKFLPELELPETLDPFPTYITYGSYEFEGAITALLLSNGAYINSELPDDTARSMARRFVDVLLPDSRPYATIFRVDGAWANWFCDVAWDATFLVFSPKQQRWWLLCITDTD